MTFDYMLCYLKYNRVLNVRHHFLVSDHLVDIWVKYQFWCDTIITCCLKNKWQYCYCRLVSNYNGICLLEEWEETRHRCIWPLLQEEPIPWRIHNICWFRRVLKVSKELPLFRNRLISWPLIFNQASKILISV